MQNLYMPCSTLPAPRFHISFHYHASKIMQPVSLLASDLSYIHTCSRYSTDGRGDRLGGVTCWSPVAVNGGFQGQANGDLSVSSE